MKRLASVLSAICIFLSSSAQQYDVCVYGGTSAGVIAAYTAAMLHKTVILIEPGNRLGGLTTGGLGYTDIGNKYAITGIARDFYRRIGKRYNKFEQWIFEPHVAEDVFKDYIHRGKVPVLFEHRIVSALKQDGWIKQVVVENSANPLASANKTITAKMFIDCSYEGDLLAKAGIPYIVGREANSVYNETYNGVQLRDKHQFPDGISPYKIPGDTASGLLWGVSTRELAPQGSGDGLEQTYNFRICLTSDPLNKIEITRPAGYDSTWYELLLRVIAKNNPKSIGDFLSLDLMPNHKTDINNKGPFSTDMIGENYMYANGSYAERERIRAAHELYTKGLLYFIGHDARMPAGLRNQMLQWGYPKDEYPQTNHWSPQMYVREARRMIGDYVMTQANCESRETVTDGIGMAAYTMDSHNCERLVVNGMVKNEGDVQIGGFGPYPVSYRCLIPKAVDCKNLLVPVCLSASHIAYGSIRMEPVFMVLAQSGAAAACQAIDKSIAVQQVDVPALQQQLRENPLMDGSTPEVLADNDDTAHVQVSGDWVRKANGCYGPSRLEAAAGTTGSVIFTPQIKKAGKYVLYSYIPALSGGAAKTSYAIYNGTQTKTIPVTTDITVEGQTSGEWVSLGVYTFTAGNKSTVTITAGNNGIVTADAILFVPEK
ncbi:MAG TPA: FAD-dependent oxidoreductase [Chitinophagaceae bacterium]|nr:FAD-dependent oxidoreductase [Chitinophagaceae bacterium]